MTALDILNDIDNKDELLEEQELFRIIASKRVSADIEAYIYACLDNLEIKVPKHEYMKVKNLASKNLLDGFCFESTETMVVFFSNAYIVRGYLNLGKRGKYYHAWMVINYQKIEYVFDPTSDIIVLKDDFDKVFQVEELVKIPSSLVSDALIRVLKGENHDEHITFDEETNKAIRDFCSSFFGCIEDEGYKAKYSDDINEPMYRNSSIYEGIIENKSIKSLRVRFYDASG